ncbi:MAG: ATP-binding protein [Anaerolineaceae bacterium]|nr:ATP-binding protein [Anaerolineaceae bacterium]
MSLRLRLILLFTLMGGGGSLVIGTLAYSLVSLTLIDQVDNSLTQSALQLTEQLRVNSFNQFDTRSLRNFQVAENLLFQVWGVDGQLYLGYPVDIFEALNHSEELQGSPQFGTFQSSRGSIRVLSVPLQTARNPVGVLQVGMSLSIIEAAQQRWISIIMIITLITMPLVGLGAWFVAGRALEPLARVTEIATQITKADDLMRRIPLSGTTEDEVGQMIQAFNETLERLENLFTSQNRFLADVSHDLRTPLTVIKGNVGLMRRMGCTDEESINSIEMEVDRLTRLVGDLLLLAQTESGSLPIDEMVVDLDTVLLEVFQQMRHLAGDRIKLTLLEIDQIQMIGDRDRLKQVLLNLVGNAIQHTPQGGDVKLWLRKKDGRIEFQVSDNGPGISEEDLPHIFERFYRGEKSRKRDKGSGFGLGLSIVKGIINAHGGVIEVESRLGEGTTFTVGLPLVKDHK